MHPSELYSVDAPHFNAGIVVIAGMIVEAAPILRWSVGKTMTEFERYCQRKGWTINAAPDAAKE